MLVPVAPPGAVPGSRGPDTTIPAPATNAAAAMRMPGRRYHDEPASVGSAVRVAPGVASNTFIAHPPGPKAPKTGVSGIHELPADKSRHWSNRGAGSPVSWHCFLRVVRGPIAGVSTCRKCAPPDTTWYRVEGYSKSLAVPVAGAQLSPNPDRPTARDILSSIKA